MPGKRKPEDARREQILKAAFEVASREGIGSLTVRAVAAEAGLSHALVLYHFQRKDRLVHELLEWLIATTSMLRLSADVADPARPLDRLNAVLQQEMTRLSQQPRHIRLFFEFWALGAREEAIRVRISAELERYRAAFRSITDEMLALEPSPKGMTADGMAAVAVSWIYGCAVQAMVDSQRFDTDDYLAAVRGMIRQLV